MSELTREARNCDFEPLPEHRDRLNLTSLSHLGSEMRVSVRPLSGSGFRDPTEFPIHQFEPGTPQTGAVIAPPASPHCDRIAPGSGPQSPTTPAPRVPRKSIFVWAIVSAGAW